VVNIYYTTNSVINHQKTNIQSQSIATSDACWCNCSSIRYR